MKASSVRIDRDLRDALRCACLADRLANYEAPTLEAGVLSSCHQVAFHTCEQHNCGVQ